MILKELLTSCTATQPVNMGNNYRMIIISESRKKPEIIHVVYFTSPHLTKALLQACINIVYNHASLDDYRLFAYIDNITLYNPRKIAEITADTSCTIWPERIPTTSIYINNIYIRTMGGKGE